MREVGTGAISSAQLEEAERELAKASHEADQAYYAWKRNPNKSTWQAWGRATEREHDADERRRLLELAMDADPKWIMA
jgi:hypothetical protein